MTDFIVYYSSSCPFDNTADKVMRDLTHHYPEIRGRIECLVKFVLSTNELGIQQKWSFGD